MSNPVLRGIIPPPFRDPEIAVDEGVIAGRVLHAETERPVPGVTVQALSTGRLAQQRVLASALSADDGTYRLADLPGDAGRVRIIAMGGGWVNAEIAHGPASPEATRGWEADLRPGRAFSWNVRVLPAGRIRGTVLDADGRPAADVVVHVPHWPGWDGPGYTQPEFPWPHVPATRTDGEGRFTLDGLPWGDSVRVEAYVERGLAVDSKAVAVRPPRTTTVTLLLPAARAARVRVVDAESGEPVVGAHVRMHRRDGRENDFSGQEETTDGAGSVALGPLGVDAAALEIWALGYETWHLKAVGAAHDDAWDLFAPGENGHFEAVVALEPASVLAGRVVMAKGFTPADVWLLVIPIELEDSRLEDGGTRPSPCYWPLDAEGRFCETVRPGWRWQIVVQSLLEESPWGDSWELKGPTDASSGDENIVVHVKATRFEDWLQWEDPFWDLHLLGPDGEVPSFADVDLAFEAADDWAILDDFPLRILAAQPDKTDPGKGLRCRIPVWHESGPAWISVHAEGPNGEPLAHIVRGPFNADGGQATISIPRARTICGQIVDPRGMAVQGVEVEARTPRPPGLPADRSFFDPSDAAISDAAGHFVLGSLDHGPVELHVVHATAWVGPAPVIAQAGARDVIVRLLGGVEATVVVRDEAGNPVAGASVRVGPDDDDQSLATRAGWLPDDVSTHEDGHAVLRALESARTYRLEVAPPKPLRDDLVLIEVRCLTPQDVEIILPAFRSIAGVVRSPAGLPVEEVRVSLCEHDQDRIRGTVTDAEGRFTFSRVRPGPVRIGACVSSLKSYGGETALTEDAEAGESELVLVLDPGREVQLDTTALRNEDGWISRLQLTPLHTPIGAAPIHRVWILNEESTLRVRGLVPGVRYRIWGGPMNAGLFTEAVLEPTHDRCVLSLRQGGTIRGTITWSEGASRATVGIDHRGVCFDGGLALMPKTFTLRGVPEGTWPVKLAWMQDGQWCETVKQSRAGDTLTFDLTKAR